jgi:ligand-binding sensor domain-containing protein
VDFKMVSHEMIILEMQRWTGLLLFTIGWGALSAQSPPPVGQWREHLPWNNAVNVSLSGTGVYCATPYAVFLYDPADESFTRMSKVNGLSDIGVSAMTHDPVSGNTVIAYQNSNLDIWKGGRVVNIPDIRISSTSGNKTIHRIAIRGDMAYLSTGLGVIVIDMKKNQVRDTWRIGNAGAEVPVWGLAFSGNRVFAATEEGLKSALLSSDPSDYRNWQLLPLPPGPAQHVIASGTRVYALLGESVFSSSGGNFSLFYQRTGISSIDTAGTGLLVSERSGNTGRVVHLDASANTLRVYQPAGLSFPKQAVLSGQDCWIADFNNGLFRAGATDAEKVFPNSPINIATGQMSFVDGSLWVAAGTVNEAWNYTFNPNGIYRLKDQYWDGYNRYVNTGLDSLYDFITVAGQPATGSVYVGSYGGGLLEIRKDNSRVIYKQTSPLAAAVGDPGSYRVSGLATDRESNLWISNYGAPQNLLVKKADGSWKSFTIPFFHAENATAGITIDDLGQKWIVSPKQNGLFVFNSGSSIDNTGDDRWRYYRQGRGNGNLPSNNVYCAVKDKNGFIWVGTDKGIAVVNCVQEAVNSNCEAILPIIQEDNFAGFLFRDEEVLSIAVDGANRKWVGTRNGLWLVAAEGDKIIYRFTKANSPLLADEISSLAIDPVSGEVFAATSAGICSFRSTATEGETGGNNVLVYPNPVPPGFGGTIAVRGLPVNATVKITELDGRLVFQTRSLGGQAIWNGRDYKGNRASSGVYLVIVADEQNVEKLATKIFFLK